MTSGWVGILGGPLGVIVGGATGLLAGSLFDIHDDDETRSVLGEISTSIRVGPPALLAEVSEDSPAAVDAAEIAAAEHAQREAKKKARQELRDAHRRRRLPSAALVTFRPRKTVPHRPLPS